MNTIEAIDKGLEEAISVLKDAQARLADDRYEAIAEVKDAITMLKDTIHGQRSQPYPNRTS